MVVPWQAAQPWAQRQCWRELRQSCFPLALSCAKDCNLCDCQSACRGSKKYISAFCLLSWTHPVEAYLLACNKTRHTLFPPCHKSVHPPRCWRVHTHPSQVQPLPSWPFLAPSWSLVVTENWPWTTQHYVSWRSFETVEKRWAGDEFTTQRQCELGSPWMVEMPREACFILYSWPDSFLNVGKTIYIAYWVCICVEYAVSVVLALGIFQ